MNRKEATVAITDESEWKQFIDSNGMEVIAPAYLRQQRKMILLQAPKSILVGRAIRLVGITVEGIQAFESAKRAIDNAKGGTYEPMGTEILVHRKGPATLFTNAYELFGGDRVLATNEIRFDWTVLFERPNSFINARILGRGARETFVTVAKRIFDSIRISAV
jgi:hypothetical protein